MTSGSNSFNDFPEHQLNRFTNRNYDIRNQAFHFNTRTANFYHRLCISFQAYLGDAENARHETTRKETTAPKYPNMHGWKLREMETVAQCCKGWKIRDMNIRERQSIETLESRWL